MGRVFVTGDIHANAYQIRQVIHQIDNPQSDDIIIICGDAGFEYQEYNMGQAKREARKFPGKWIVLRGNHDSRYWKEHGANEDQLDKGWHYEWYNQNCYLVQDKYPNIYYLPDAGCIYQIQDYNILFIPGAYSVDKNYRQLMGYPWNPDEQLTEDEKIEFELMLREWLDNFDIDFVIGHTFPMKMQPYYEDLFLPGLNQATVDKSMEHWLDYIASIYETVPSFKHYFGGHFHDDRVLTDKYTMLYHNVEDLADYVKE